MHILSIENMSKQYGERTLFEDVTFGIGDTDRLGLIGVNGTGKTTFLKVIAGLEPPDEGRVSRAGGVQVEYLSQDPDYDPEGTVLQEVFRGASPILQVLRDYEAALGAAAARPGDEALQAQVVRLGQKMDEQNAWPLESDAKTILTKLGIDDFSAQMKTLSGGQRKRVALAGALINPAQLLILDEPTNHIDHETVAWLEQTLARRNGALLVISHDRYFLDRVTTGILELDRGRLFRYEGNYSLFLEQQAAREEREEASERKRQNLLRQELAWMMRGARARSTKQKARIERFETLSEQQSLGKAAALEMSVGSSRLGKTVIEVEHLSHDFGEGCVLQDFSYIVKRNDRIGIVGANGSGKSTLLNLIAGHLEPQAGSIKVGQTVKIGYFAQENIEMDPRLRVIEYIREEANFIATLDGGMISAAQMLERFLFPPHLQGVSVAKLSGGERRRLYLLRVLMSAPNVLLLDEPTNDLDTLTLAVLEDYLDTFPGAVLTVSHDRYFLDRVADHIFAFQAGGSIGRYPGGYSDYLDARAPQGELEKASGPKESDKTDERNQNRAPRMGFKEKREFDEIEGVIAAAEGELRAVRSQLAQGGSDFSLLQELLEREKQLLARLEELMERWAYLSELAEANESR